MKSCLQAALFFGLVLNGTAAEAASYHQAYAFAGGNDANAPSNGLFQMGSLFVGTTCTGGTYGQGTIYTVQPDGTEKIVHNFGAQGDGVCPSSALLGHVGGYLYGTTQSGGAHGLGTVFVVQTKPAGWVTRIIHSFAGGPADGKFPAGGLTSFRGLIYGTTRYGGTSTNCNYGGCGTVFFVTPHNLVGQLYSFQGGSDGALPETTLLPVGNLLFGTTRAGGSGGPCGLEGAVIPGCGTVFYISPRGQENIAYAFKGGTADGGAPGPMLVKDGVFLYGTTQFGGSAPPSNCPSGNSLPGCGTVFALLPSGAERIVHNFGATGEGVWPLGGLSSITTYASGHYHTTLYGSTSAGSMFNAAGVATLFSVTPAGTLSLLHQFTESSGPAAPLLAGNDFLVGTTPNGGNTACSGGCGTVFLYYPN